MIIEYLYHAPNNELNELEAHQWWSYFGFRSGAADPNRHEGTFVDTYNNPLFANDYTAEQAAQHLIKYRDGGKRAKKVG